MKNLHTKNCDATFFATLIFYDSRLNYEFGSSLQMLSVLDGNYSQIS